MIDGFSELSDAINDDIDPWLPNIPVMEPKIDIETAKYIVARVGDKFCQLVQQEREAKNLAGDEGQFDKLEYFQCQRQNCKRITFGCVLFCV